MGLYNIRIDSICRGLAIAAVYKGFHAAVRFARQTTACPRQHCFPYSMGHSLYPYGHKLGNYLPSHSRQKKPALTVYAVQLVLTFVWTLLFFKLKLRLASLVLLVVMVILVISMIVRFGRIKPIAGYMNIPYLLWLLFATYLNVGTYILNG